MIVGRLLAGYGELELQVCACLMMVEAAIDSPIRSLFSIRGAERRIQIGKGALWDIYGPVATFLAEAAFTIAALIGLLALRKRFTADGARTVREQ